MRRIDTFPRIMPGEALYSAVATYHLWSGNDAHTDSHLELFGNSQIRATFDLPNYLELLSARMPEARGLDAARLARETTHIGYLTVFMPRCDAERAVAKLIAGDSKLHFELGVNGSIVCRTPFLRFCVECLDDMRARAGRYWWRLDHQLPGVVICPDHSTPLRISTTGFKSEQFTFVAATDRTCPRGAEAVIETPSALLHERLLDIARRSSALLTASTRFESYEQLTDHYRERLFEAGLMITRKNLDVPRFMAEFLAFHAETLAVLAQTFEKMGKADAWILEMARTQRKIKQPVQHILFQMFLDSRSKRPERPSTFGAGPWSCPSPVASHGKGAFTIAVVREHREGHGIVGTFECECGYTYTMSRNLDGRLAGPRYKCFGPNLDPALTDLVKGGATLRGAAKYLGIHPRAVAAASSLLGLGKNWKVPSSKGSRLGRAVAVPPKDRRVANPTRSRRPSKPRLDWVAIDLETNASVEKAIEEMRLLSPPTRITIRAIERRLKLRDSWIYLRQAKLPRTMATVEAEWETTEQFQERRLRYAIVHELKAKKSVCPSRVMRSASIKYGGAWTERVRILIAELAEEPRLK